MIRFELSKRARQDLAEIHAYILSTSGENRADAVIREILRNVVLLIDFPGAGPRRDELSRGLRSLPVHSHLIFYRLRKWGVWISRASFMEPGIWTPFSSRLDGGGDVAGVEYADFYVDRRAPGN